MVAWNKYTLPQRIEAFWARVDKSSDPDGCWLWTASCEKGNYGLFSWGRKTRLAHRISWELANGSIPDRLCVLHNCPGGDNPRCVNPAHLWLGTNQDNMKDRNRKGRTASGERSGKYTHPESAPRGERNGNARLTTAIAQEIRRRYAIGDISQAKLAKEFGVGHSTVNYIVTNQIWMEAR